MPDKPSTATPFDAKRAFAGTIAVPFPKINKDTPIDRESRLETLITNLEQHNAQTRANIIHAAITKIPYLPPPTDYPLPYETLASKNADTIALLSTPPPSTSTSTSTSTTGPDTSIPSTPAQPTFEKTPGAFANIALAVRETEALLAEFDKRAEEGVKVYKDALQRVREQRRKDEGGGVVGIGRGERVGTWPTVGGGGAGTTNGRIEAEAQDQRRSSFGTSAKPEKPENTRRGSGSGPSASTGLIDASRDPRRR